jgi:hypothetical protein
MRHIEPPPHPDSDGNQSEDNTGDNDSAHSAPIERSFSFGK